MSWPKALALLLVVVTAGQLFTTIVAIEQSVIPGLLGILPIVGLWAGYAYRYLPQFRFWVVMLLAQFGNQMTSMAVSVRLGVSEDVNEQDVVKAIALRYDTPGDRQVVKVFPSKGHTFVEMPGWSVRFEFSTPPELAWTEDVDLDPKAAERHLLITRPDTQDSIRSSVALLDAQIFPLVSSIAATLEAKIEAAQVTIRFTREPNPYLAVYLQNIDLARISDLRCTIDGGRPGTGAVIKRDTIRLNATNVDDLRNLVHEHLALQWSPR